MSSIGGLLLSILSRWFCWIYQLHPELIKIYLSEQESCASWTLFESCDIVRVTPQQIWPKAIFGYFLNPRKIPDFVKSFSWRGKPTMHAKNLVLNESSQGQVVKEISQIFPYFFSAKFFVTLFIKPINLCNSPRLMVAPGQSDSIRVPDFVCKQ